MRWFQNQRGSVTEFALLAPLVLIVAFSALQLLIVSMQRSESYAVADRIAFIAAAINHNAALLESEKFKSQYSYIESVDIFRGENSVQVRLQAAVNTLLPLPKIRYEIVTISVVEP